MDIGLLRHILSNLLSNAIKYLPQGGEVRLTLHQQGHEAIFQVQDSGIGIPASDQARLFEVFYRATNVSTISGTRLGLAIVKQCVDLHKGRVEVDSAVGQGTRFTIYLPMAES